MPDPQDTSPPDALVPLEAEPPASATEPAGAAVGAAAPSPRETDEVAEIRRQRDTYYDLLLRTTAEFDNYRKRVERERREMAEAALGTVVLELLPILDDFERALQPSAVAGDVSAYRQGVELIYRKLTELLGRWGVTPIPAVGTAFDPYVHQAVAYEPSPERREGEVIEEYRRGYRLGSRVLRPALVKVAKA